MNAAARLVAATLLYFCAAAAVAASNQACRVIRAEAASYLELCGGQLRSFSLSIVDFKRKIALDPHGRFSFACSSVLDCSDEPEFGGRFIPAENWNKSHKDEGAIWDAAGLAPKNAVSWSRPGYPAQSPPKSVCGVFDVRIGDLKGRALCYSLAYEGGGVIVVASDDEVGVVLSFYSKDQDGTAVRDKMMSILPRLKVERATGDVGLMRWMK